MLESIEEQFLHQYIKKIDNLENKVNNIDTGIQLLEQSIHGQDRNNGMKGDISKIQKFVEKLGNPETIVTQLQELTTFKTEFELKLKLAGVVWGSIGLLLGSGVKEIVVYIIKHV